MRFLGRVHMVPAMPDDTDVRDRLMFLFGVLAAVLLVMSVMLVMLLALLRPNVDTTEWGKMLSTQLSLIVGAVLGYAARGERGDKE